jgi:hypothetical protein
VADTGFIALTVAVAGATATGIGAIIVDLVKREQDRKGIAAAVAGEIWALIRVAEQRKIPDHFRNLVDHITRFPNNPPSPPWLHFNPSFEPTPIAKAYVDRIGHLRGDLPARVAVWYTMHGSLRTIIQILATDPSVQDPSKAHPFMQQGLMIWDRMASDGKELARDLLALSGVEPPPMADL